MTFKNAFAAEQVTEHLYRIKDAFGVAFYLAVGADRAALIDTGYGISGLRKFVETITDRPLFVLLTHGHIDHAFGATEFDEVHMSHRDLGLFELDSNAAWRQGFIDGVLGGDHGFGLQAPFAGAFVDISDGERFDLGGEVVEAISVPGHTRGMTAFLFERDRAMLLGDACGPGTLLTEDTAADISTYREALLRVKAMEDRYDLVLRNHGSCESPKELLDNVIELCDRVLAGTDDRVPLPQDVGAVYPIKSDLPYYQAAATLPNSQDRTDGKVGNIIYRADKAR